MAQTELRVKLGNVNDLYASVVLKINAVANGSSADPKSKVTATLYGEIHKNLPNYNVGPRSETTITINGKKFSTPASSWVYSGLGLYKLAEIVTNVAHDRTGKKNLDFGFYYPIMATTNGVYRDSITASASIALDNIKMWEASIAPKNLVWSSTPSVGNYILPNSAITLTWVKGLAGKDNPLELEKLEIWRSDTKETQTITKPSMPYTHTSQIPEGAYYQYRVVSVATHDEKITPWSAKIYVAKEPKRPTITWSDGSVVSYATETLKPATITGGVTSTGVNEVYYALTEKGQKQRLTSSVNLSLLVGANTFWFWTWDGLRYSPSLVKTVERVKKPVLNSFSATKIGNFTDSTHSNANYPLAARANIQYTVNGFGKVRIEVLRGSSTSSINTVSQVIESTISLLTDNINIDLAKDINDPFGQYVRVRIRYENDYGDTTEYSTQANGFFLGNPIQPNNFYNTNNISFEVDASETHFYKNLTITHSINTLITSEVHVATELTGLKRKISGTHTRTDNRITIEGLTNASVPNQRYYFYLRSIHPNGSTHDILVGDKRQVPEWTFQNVIFPTLINPVEGASSSQAITFVDNTNGRVNGLKEDYSIPDVKNFVARVRKGTSQIEVGTAAYGSTGTISLTRQNVQFYPWSFNKTDKQSDNNHNPFALEYGKNHLVEIEIMVTNAFGQSFSTKATTTIELKRAFYFASRYASNYKIKSSLKGFQRIVQGKGTTNLQVFENEAITAIAQLPQVQKGQIYYYQFRRKINNGPFQPYGARRPAIGDGSTEIWEVESEVFYTKEEDANKSYEFDIQFFGDPEGQITQIFTAKIVQPRFIGINIALNEEKPFIFYENDIEVRYSTENDIGVSDLNILKKIELVLEKSGDGKDPIQKVVTINNPSQAEIGGGRTHLFTNAGELLFEPGEVAQYRFGIIRYPKRMPVEGTNEDWGGEKIAWTDYFRTYPDLPSYRWRKNYMGINSPSESPNAVFEVYAASNDKRMIYLADQDRWILIDLGTGQVLNAMIDGGTYGDW